LHETTGFAILYDTVQNSSHFGETTPAPQEGGKDASITRFAAPDSWNQAPR
jgi:hypothetical protein